MFCHHPISPTSRHFLRSSTGYTNEGEEEAEAEEAAEAAEEEAGQVAIHDDLDEQNSVRYLEYWKRLSPPLARTMTNPYSPDRIVGISEPFSISRG